MPDKPLRARSGGEADGRLQPVTNPRAINAYRYPSSAQRQGGERNVRGTVLCSLGGWRCGPKCCSAR